MKKTALSLMVVLMMAISPMVALAAETSIEGSVQGFICVTQGKTCPVGKEDPIAGIERVFVILTSSNGYYFVPNVDRAVLARHINERIRVTGVMSDKFKAIQASKIESLYKGMWERTWGQVDELDMLKNLNLLPI